MSLFCFVEGMGSRSLDPRAAESAIYFSIQALADSVFCDKHAIYDGRPPHGHGRPAAQALNDAFNVGLLDSAGQGSYHIEHPEVSRELFCLKPSQSGEGFGYTPSGSTSSAP